jgi:hypothetical protein
MKHKKLLWSLIDNSNLVFFILYGVVLYLGLFDFANLSELERGEKIYELIFIEFFSYFLIVYFFRMFADLDKVRKGSLFSKENINFLIIFSLVNLLIGYFIYDFSGSLSISSLIFLNNFYTIRNFKQHYLGALAKVVLIFITAFLVALIFLMLGQSEDTVLIQDLNSAFVWFLCYFGLCLFVSILDHHIPDIE